MKLISLTFPEQTSEWANWLQLQLMSDHLGDLVRELQIIVNDQSSTSLTLKKILGEQRKDVLESGLGTLSEAQIMSLLKQPQLLMELQEQVLVEGGDWVDEHAVSAVELDFDERWNRLAAKLQQVSPDANFETIIPPTSLKPTARKSSPFIKALGLLTLVLLVGVSFWLSRPPVASGWGFNQSGLLSANVSDSEYLESLAVAANAWFNKRPTNAPELETRLQQFRAGCEVLLSAEHNQLAAADQEWLRTKCQAWIDKIDGHLAEIPKEDFAKVLEQADATIKSLSEALRQRALEVA